MTTVANPASASGELVHASCVAIGTQAVLITGPSGSGKSDLALRLIDRGATLVSDDYTQLHADAASGTVIASPPGTIAGRIEARGLGILTLPWRGRAPVALVVALATGGEPPVERLPFEPGQWRLCGRDIPLVRLCGFEASAPIKLEYMMRACAGSAPCPDTGIDP